MQPASGSNGPVGGHGTRCAALLNELIPFAFSEADQIHIIGLTKALKQGITVAYLDASHSSHDPTFHRFLASDEEEDVGQELGICLLYRPGMPKNMWTTC